MQILRIRLLLFFFVTFLIAGCAIQKNPVTGSTRAFGYSWDQEVDIGKKADPEIIAQFGLYNEERLAAYVTEMGERILGQSHLRRPETGQQFRETEFTFRLLDSPVINAFALPGGYVYFTRGMMAHLSNEAQFAVVMGHEIGHVAARHASQRALRQSIGQVFVIGGSLLGQEIFGLPGQALMDLSHSAAQMLYLSHSRAHERESDRLGVEYAALDGFDAAEGAVLFTSLKRIAEQHEQNIPNFLSTHPDPGERELTIPRIAGQWAERGYEQTSRNEDRYMEMINGLVFGEDPRQGFSRDGYFYHPDLAFQYEVPPGWEVINQPSQVILLGPEEKAVSAFRIDSGSATPQQSVQSILSRDGINLISEETAANRGNLNAYSAIAGATLGDGTPLTLHIYAAAYENRIFRFINYSERNRFNDFESDFTSITESFDRLVDPDILNTEPVRLQTFRAGRSGRFETFLPETLPMHIRPLDVAIINQVELDEHIDQGRWLKMPVQ
ncbi:MAG: M48 family metalloprotease [Balneolales bacterium]